MTHIRTCLAFVCSLLMVPAVCLAQDFGAITFAFDSDELDPSAQAQIDEIAQTILQTDSYKPSVVVGYTDAVGSSGYNFDLGLRRAQRVSEALIAAGVPVDRIGTIQSRGKAELLVPVSVPERRNRRVTVGLSDMLAACSSYRSLSLGQGAIGPALQSDLVANLQTAATARQTFTSSGANAPAFQMAGAAQQDCSVAVGLNDSSVRKLEYAKKCLCNSARLQVALGN